MRLAQVGLGSGVGLSGKKQKLVDSWSGPRPIFPRSEEHTSELQSLRHLVCPLVVLGCGDRRHLHSFPTRRSSDLLGWDPASGYLEKNKSLSIPGQVRVLFFLTRNARQLPQPMRPRDRKSTRLNSSHL